MKRMFILELKRILKTRSSMIYIGIALFLSISLAFMVIGNERLLDQELTPVFTGMDAVKWGHEIDKPYEGYVTPDALKTANVEYVSLYNQYEGEFPSNIYQEKIWPLRTYVNLVGSVYDDETTGYTLSPVEIGTEKAAAFYEGRLEAIQKKIAKEVSYIKGAEEQILEMNANVETHFYFASYRGWDIGGEYIHLVILFIILLCTMLVAPIFSSEYQTASDSILRCTRYGRKKLGLVKIAAAIFISLSLILVSMLLFMGILCSFLGTDGLRTSIQMITATAFVPLTMGEVHTITIISGILTLLAVICCTLFFSSICKSPLTTLIFSLGIALMPTLLRVVSGGQWVEWLRYCLPSGGVGMGISVYYELVYDYNFLSLGSAAIWAPYLMTAASIIEIIIFPLLTLRYYNRHEAS